MTLMGTTQVNPAEEPFAMLSGKPVPEELVSWLGPVLIHMFG